METFNFSIGHPIYTLTWSVARSTHRQLAKVLKCYNAILDVLVYGSPASNESTVLNINVCGVLNNNIATLNVDLFEHLLYTVKLLFLYNATHVLLNVLLSEK